MLSFLSCCQQEVWLCRPQHLPFSSGWYARSSFTRSVLAEVEGRRNRQTASRIANIREDCGAKRFLPAVERDMQCDNRVQSRSYAINGERRQFLRDSNLLFGGQNRV